MSLLDRIVPPDPATADGPVKPSRQQREERLATVALGAANLLVCIGLLVALPSLEADASTRRTKGLLLLGACVASLLCVPAARYGNRLVSGLAVLGCGFLGPGAVITLFFVIPHYGLAMWMILRQNRLVKVQAEERRKQRLAGGTAAPRSRSRGRSARTPPKLPDGRPAPNASKRYTPPRPKKRVTPPPAAKGSKAAEPADVD